MSVCDLEKSCKSLLTAHAVQNHRALQAQRLSETAVIRENRVWGNFATSQTSPSYVTQNPTLFRTSRLYSQADCTNTAASIGVECKTPSAYYWLRLSPCIDFASLFHNYHTKFFSSGLILYEEISILLHKTCFNQAHLFLQRLAACREQSSKFFHLDGEMRCCME